MSTDKPRSQGKNIELQEKQQEQLHDTLDSKDLARNVDALLQRPFDEVLRQLPALQRHLEAQEDVREVEEEFRAAWHLEAPPELRQLLEELLDPAAAVDEPASSMLDTDDLNGRVEALLERPFDEALRLLPALRQHLDAQEDAADVEEEFRAAWHPEAPAELRQVLEELIDPAAAAASAEATEAFLRNPAAAFPSGPPGNDEGEEFPSFDEEFGEAMKGMRSGDTPEDDGEDENQPDLRSAVDELLQKSFDEALLALPALKEHIASQEDARDVEDEFRESWHPEAPEALRQVLEELLYPAGAAANAEETSTFLARMAGIAADRGPASSHVPMLTARPGEDDNGTSRKVRSKL